MAVETVGDRYTEEKNYENSLAVSVTKLSVVFNFTRSGIVEDE